jgi:hypothetical protein
MKEDLQFAFAYVVDSTIKPSKIAHGKKKQFVKGRYR